MTKNVGYVRLLYQRIVRSLSSQPYNVNTAAEAAGLAAIEHRGLILETCAILRQQRDRLYEELKKASRKRTEISYCSYV